MDVNTAFITQGISQGLHKSTATSYIKKLLECNLDYNYPLPKELAPNGIPFGAKSSGKVQLQSKLGSDLQDSEKTSLCVLN